MTNLSLVQRCIIQAEFEQLRGDPHLADLLNECVVALCELLPNG